MSGLGSDLRHGLWSWVRRPRLSVESVSDWSDLRLEVRNGGKRTAADVSLQILEWLSPTNDEPISGNRFLGWTGTGRERLVTLPPGARATVDFLHFVPEPSPHSEWTVPVNRRDPAVARLCVVENSIPMRFFAPGSLGSEHTPQSRSAVFLLSILSRDVSTSCHRVEVSYSGGAPFPHVRESDGRSISRHLAVKIEEVDSGTRLELSN